MTVTRTLFQGFEWNKYNQTHYDVDNPPPKIVQGYRFNVSFAYRILHRCRSSIRICSTRLRRRHSPCCRARIRTSPCFASMPVLPTRTSPSSWSTENGRSITSTAISASSRTASSNYGSSSRSIDIDDESQLHHRTVIFFLIKLSVVR